MPTTYNQHAPRVGPGIYALEDIRQRCRIDDVTGCWIWGLACGTSRASRTLTPRVSIPAGVLSSTHRTVSVARLAWLMSGNTLGPGHVVWRCCGNDLCVRPRHLRAGTKSEEGAWMRASGHRRGDPHRAAVNLRNSALQMLSLETVREIETRLAAGELQADVAASMGVNKATVCKINRGKHRHQRTAGTVAVASVFSASWAADASMKVAA